MVNIIRAARANMPIIIAAFLSLFLSNSKFILPYLGERISANTSNRIDITDSSRVMFSQRVNWITFVGYYMVFIFCSFICYSFSDTSSLGAYILRKEARII